MTHYVYEDRLPKRAFMGTAETLQDAKRLASQENRGRSASWIKDDPASEGGDSDRDKLYRGGPGNECIIATFDIHAARPRTR